MKMIFQGGIEGAPRMTRHIWRMCFALLLATVSFFLRQMQVFPEFLQKIQILIIPVLIVLISLLFWVYQSLFTNRYKKRKRLA
ncbi:MAG: purine-cytosine permease-like protein [Paraglaciecola sp.]|jgi:purine-cytosine permease-like protein